ncbi:hypothetical protein [Mycoplasmopsis canis]|uniref:hypothetical protein n=1 Tax=Mycoplasmopsis canis TaxID=29555 RepID=UPI0012BB08F7|nr:hypothetical protein [Mycoplasmopsis canis]
MSKISVIIPKNIKNLNTWNNLIHLKENTINENEKIKRIFTSFTYDRRGWDRWLTSKLSFSEINSKKTSIKGEVIFWKNIPWISFFIN